MATGTLTSKTPHPCVYDIYRVYSMWNRNHIDVGRDRHVRSISTLINWKLKCKIWMAGIYTISPFKYQLILWLTQLSFFMGFHFYIWLRMGGMNRNKCHLCPIGSSERQSTYGVTSKVSKEILCDCVAWVTFLFISLQLSAVSHVLMPFFVFNQRPSNGLCH